mmetsp:Transcript_6203/g.12912  ORF Transcript_6203/g.12912 Transcript_6203/m.12912 type:complete len:241 (-) Transcript_6203:725-1447(-)
MRVFLLSTQSSCIKEHHGTGSSHCYNENRRYNLAQSRNFPNMGLTWPTATCACPTAHEAAVMGPWRLGPLWWGRGAPLGQFQPARRPTRGARGSRDGLLARPQDARPMAAQPRRLRDRPARYGRWPARRAHTSGAGRRGIAVSDRRHARTVTCSCRSGPTGRCGGRPGSSGWRPCDGMTAAIGWPQRPTERMVTVAASAAAASCTPAGDPLPLAAEMARIESPRSSRLHGQWRGRWRRQW